MGVSSSATTVTNFVGATSGFALIGAFLSDSYISRSRTILLFGPLEFLVILLSFFLRSGNFALDLCNLHASGYFTRSIAVNKCKPTNSTE